MSTKSLASAQNDYVAVQGQVSGDQLHIQGIGHKVNRSYGVAVTLPAPNELLTFVNGLARTKKSGTGSGNTYAPFQVAVRGDKAHFQIAGPSLNRPYGAAFSSNNPQIVSFVKGQLVAETAATEAAVKAAEAAKLAKETAQKNAEAAKVKAKQAAKAAAQAVKNGAIVLD